MTDTVEDTDAVKAGEAMRKKQVRSRWHSQDECECEDRSEKK